MSVVEMKKTIIDKVETLTEEQLFEVKQFLERIKSPATEYDLLPHIKNIVAERQEVLKKLAQ